MKIKNLKLKISAMNARYILLSLILIGICTIFGYNVTHALFSDAAQSTDNTFAAADIFPGSAGSVVINEIMWMGTGVNAADEWIELRNMTSSAIDLSNWIIENLGSGTNSVIVPAGKTIAPNGFFFIANDPKETGRHNVDPDLIINISLSNSPSEQLVLRASPSGTVIDTADDSLGGWFAGVSGTGQNPDKSMARNDPPGNGTISTNWFTSTISANLDPGASESATPKAANGL